MGLERALAAEIPCALLPISQALSYSAPPCLNGFPAAFSSVTLTSCSHLQSLQLQLRKLGMCLQSFLISSINSLVLHPM